PGWSLRRRSAMSRPSSSPAAAIEFPAWRYRRATRPRMIRADVPPFEALMKRPTAALAAFSFFALLSSAATAADADQGGVLAKRWCATCHVVSADQARGGTQAPPFSEIARKPGLTDASIALCLLRPHPPMPDMNLSRGEAADLAAYI